MYNTIKLEIPSFQQILQEENIFKQLARQEYSNSSRGENIQTACEARIFKQLARPGTCPSLSHKIPHQEGKLYIKQTKPPPKVILKGITNNPPMARNVRFRNILVQVLIPWATGQIIFTITIYYTTYYIILHTIYYTTLVLHN